VADVPIEAGVETTQIGSNCVNDGTLRDLLSHGFERCDHLGGGDDARELVGEI
jgi:hypothetical protein